MELCGHYDHLACVNGRMGGYHPHLLHIYLVDTVTDLFPFIYHNITTSNNKRFFKINPQNKLDKCKHIMRGVCPPS